MKTIINKSVAALAVISFIIAGCSKNYGVIEEAAYISQTKTLGNVSSVVKISESPAIVNLNVKLTRPMPENHDFSLSPDKEVLERFNKRNGTKYTMLPETAYKLENGNLTITSGNSFSDPVKITVMPLSDSLMNSGEKYAIALKLQKKDNIRVIKGTDEIVYVIEPTIITTCPVLGVFNGYYAAGKATAAEEVELRQWTIEMRVNMSGFGINNQALFGTWGKDSEIYMRFGDAFTPWNSLQVKFGSAGQFDKSNTLFVPDTWYHIAVVYDGTKCTLYINGKKDLDTDKPAGRVFRLGKDLHFTGSSRAYFRNSCMMSEVRIWDVARTAEQLAENEFSVSASSEGLLHYWKMNEGSGNVFKDSAKKAPADIIVQENVTPVWVNNIRSDGKGRTSPRQ